MVPRRIEFALRTRSQRMNTDVHFRTDTDVRGSNQQRCFCGAKTRVRKCTRMYTSGQAIFKKANGERLFRTDKDVGGSIQKRVCLQTRSPRMYTDVHSWARHLRRRLTKNSPRRTKSTPAGVFCTLLASVPPIFKKAVFSQIYGTSTASLVQRSTSVYFAEHKFDRCQTCFCLIRAASMPLLKILNVSKPPRTAVVPSRIEFALRTRS